jgi:hypothetical protein
MQLWVVAILFLFIISIVPFLLYLSLQSEKKRALIVGACVLGAIALVFAVYIMLAFFFPDAL